MNDTLNSTMKFLNDTLPTFANETISGFNYPTFSPTFEPTYVSSPAPTTTAQLLWPDSYNEFFGNTWKNLTGYSNDTYNAAINDAPILFNETINGFKYPTFFPTAEPSAGNRS